MQVGTERFRAAEVLFQPELIGLEYPGVHHCVFRSIMRADLDLRKTLYSRIVLAGGSTMLRGRQNRTLADVSSLAAGFGDRLLEEVRRLAPRGTKLRITADPKRQVLTWGGGCVPVSLAQGRNHV